MIRHLVLFASGTLAAASVACVAYVQPTPPPTAFASACATSSIPFLKNAQLLSSYDPDPKHHNTTPSGSGPLPDPYCSSLLNAYNIASNSGSPTTGWPFQEQLNNLTNV